MFFTIYFILLPLQIASHSIHNSVWWCMVFICSVESDWIPNRDAVTLKCSFENVCGYDDCSACRFYVCDAHNTFYHRKTIQNTLCSILKVDLVVQIGGEIHNNGKPLREFVKSSCKWMRGMIWIRISIKNSQNLHFTFQWNGVFCSSSHFDCWRENLQIVDQKYQL